LDDCINFALFIHTVRDYRQLQHNRYSTHFPVHRYTRARILSPLAVSLQRIYHSLTVTSTTHEVFLAQSNSFFAIPSRLLHFTTSVLYSLSDFLCPFNLSARSPRKAPSSIVKEACVLLRYLAMDVLLSRARMLREYVYRPVA
jgi:hypothetical protein